MRLVFHGGKCCCIKTIYGFGTNPKAKVPAVEAKKSINPDQGGQHVNSDMDFFTDAAPDETYLERLDRLIEFCQRKRPHGIIEVALATADCPCCNQVTVWKPLLEERGFKEVANCYNSNSTNRVHVFYLISDKA